MAQHTVDGKKILSGLVNDVRALSQRVDELEVSNAAMTDAVYLLLSQYLDQLYAVPEEQFDNTAVQHVLTLLVAVDEQRAAVMLINIAEQSGQQAFDDVCNMLEDLGVDVDAILEQRNS